MDIMFIAPFNNSPGIPDVFLENIVTVLEMLDYLMVVIPGFREAMPQAIYEETVRNRFLVFVNGELAKLEDTIEDQDVIEILSPMSGG